MSVNRKNVRKWVDALRSGEFEQAKGTLRDPDDRFCCLGVACELYRRETGLGDWRVRESGYWWFITDGEEENELLARDARDWLGLEWFDPFVGDEDEARSLSAHNDTGASFAEIADLIEREWLQPDEQAA